MALRSELSEIDLIIDGEGPALMRKWVPSGATLDKILGFTYRSSNLYKMIDGVEHKLVSYRKSTPFTKKVKQIVRNVKNINIPEYNWE